jgi:hypothetical protein
MVLWQRPYRQVEVYIFVALLAFVTGYEIVRAGSLLELIPLYAVCIGLYAWISPATRITVTEQEVIVRQFRRPEESARRVRVDAVHIYLSTLLFVSFDREPVLHGPNIWTRSQLAALAYELNVALYDHRTRWRLDNAQTGRLIQDRH